MRFRHPSDRRLQQWLDGEESELDAHVESCQRCADRIEHLAAATTPLRGPLLQLLAPPDGLGDLLRGGIDDRMRTREDLTLVGELFGLPIRAARVMSSTTTSNTRES
ncbi:MAG: hypothetical protein AAF567_14040 [Actinomycetota bacterium]